MVRTCSLDNECAPMSKTFRIAAIPGDGIGIEVLPKVSA